jgi:multicomponent K+:H+ antiporter subunit D
MSVWLSHLVIMPVILPLLASAFMLLLDERQRKIKAATTLITTAAVLGVTLMLLRYSGDGAIVYTVGNWAAPFGIALVADPLSIMMVALTSLLGLGTLLFSLARWDRAGPRFHALFMLLLMGVNGAFLTGDLFNLFVFFEVLLAASYGLVLHGSGEARAKAGLHYIAINLLASSLFLIGVSMIYGVTGTLNMADLALRIPDIPASDLALFEIGMVMLGLVFLIKAGMWPLGFWLPPAYSAASAPAAAVFAIMTKVGVYALLRLSFLLPGGEDGRFADQWIFAGGIATIAYGAVIVLSSRTLSRIAGACVFISSGTLIAAMAVNSEKVLAGGLFYLVISTLAIGAFFLLIELINRVRGTNAPVLAEPVFSDEYHDPYENGIPDDEQVVITPAALALLSGGFLFCALLLAGLPPLPAFIGKLAIMAGLLEGDGVVADSAWLFIGVLIVSSLTTLIAMVRLGIEALWVPKDVPPPKIVRIEFFAIAGLLLSCLALTFYGGEALAYMEETARWLQAPQGYIDAVLKKEPQ